MEPYQQRVLEEKYELDLRLSSLIKFMGTQKFKELPKEDQTLLAKQQCLMHNLSIVLGKRIQGF